MPGVAGRRRRRGHQAGDVARRRAGLRSAQPDTAARRHTARARAPGDQPERQVDGGDARGGDRGSGWPRGGRAVARDQRGQLLHERHVRGVGTGDRGQRARRGVRASPAGAVDAAPSSAVQPMCTGQVQGNGDHEQQAHRGRRGLRRVAAGRRFRAHRARHRRRQPGQWNTRDQAERYTRSQGRLPHARHGETRFCGRRRK